MSGIGKKLIVIKFTDTELVDIKSFDYPAEELLAQACFAEGMKSKEEYVQMMTKERFFEKYLKPELDQEEEE